MKRFVAFFFVFVAFGVWHKAVAQFSVTLNVDPNPTPEILEWAINPQTVQLTVTNLTSNTERYKIKAQLFKDNELVGETRTEASPLRIIEANSVEVYFAEDVVPEGATKLYGNIDKVVIKTGKIPAGTYRLCTKLVDESGQINLTTDYCQTFFVTSYQQPRLILPIDGNSVPYTGAVSSLNFQWSPVLPQPRFPVYYQIRVVPKMEGQTALYAFRYNTPIINEKVAGSTNFIWPVNALEITPDADYVWGVISLDEDEKPIGENEGLSEIWGFRFVEPSVVGKLGSFSNQNGNDCAFEISNFALAGNEPYFEPGPQNFQDYANAPFNDFFVYTFNKQTSLTQNMTTGFSILEGELTFNVIESNIPLLFQPLNHTTGDYAILPLWEESLSVDNKEQVYFKLNVCFQAELIEDVGNDEIMHWCAKERCIEINYTGAQVILNNSPASGSVVADCNSILCTPQLITFTPTLPIDSVVKLCGGLEMKVKSTNLTSTAQGINLYSGTGEVYIPWLASAFNVYFDDIKVNSDMELAEGDVFVSPYISSDLPDYPDALGMNIGVNFVKKIGKWVKNNTSINIPDGPMQSLSGSTSLLNVPVGINKAIPLGNNSNANKGITIAITGLKFSPGQNFLQACAAIIFNDSDAGGDTLSFKSDNFFFTAAGPVRNTGNSVDLKIQLMENIIVKYGSVDGDPIFLKLKKDDTFIKVTSDCNKSLDWCIQAELDIEMPRTWLLPLIDDGTSKVSTTVSFDICDVNDFLINLNLPPSVIAGTNGMELSITELTWDNSSSRNANGFTFPQNYPDVNNFKGFNLTSGEILLPKSFLNNNNARINVNLNNWVIHYKWGITGTLSSYGILPFPGLNLTNLGGSIDTVEIKIWNGVITNGKIAGQLLLPLCDNKGTTPSNGHFNYRALLNSNFSSSQQQGLHLNISSNNQNGIEDCPFFANGKLSLEKSSNLNIIISDVQSEVYFKLNGNLDFPDKDILTYKLKMKSDFENVEFKYTTTPNGNPSVEFNHGDWKFASEQKLFNNFPFTIDKVRKEVRTNLMQGELYVGGVGFDLVANLSDNIGGETGLAILGSISFSNGKLAAAFKGIDVETVIVYANTNSVKLDGELIFQDTVINGNNIKAVKGSLAADFKCLNVAVNVGAIFGKSIDINNSANSYRFFMVQAKALFTPGVPLFAGIALVGGGFGFYKNMESRPATTTLSSQVFSGQEFFPSKGPWGIKIVADIATTPSDEAFNGNIALEGSFSPSGGLSTLGVSGSGWSGAGVLERNQAFLNANLTASYDFTTRIFDLSIIANINKAPVLYANKVSAKLKVDGMRNKYFFHFGTPNKPNNVTVLSTFNSSMYLMFGNDSIYAPSNYFMPATRAGLAAVGAGNTYNVPSFSAAATGAGFAVGVGISAIGSGTACFGAFKYECTAGAEFNLSMLKYFQAFCWDDNSNLTLTNIGYKNYYLTTNLAFYAGASGFWWGSKIADFNAYAALAAGFPNPEYFYGNIGGSIKVGGVEMANSFDFKFGNECFPPTSQPTNSQTFTQEDATTKIGDIFTDIYVDNNDNNYNPEKALQWKANFGQNESFTIPEQQSDGSVITRKFQMRWNYTVSEKNMQGNFVPISNNDFTLGIDLNGRYYLNKNTIPKFGKPMFISASDGTKFADEFSLVGRYEISGNIKAGDFDGNGVDDLLMSKENELYIMFNDGNMFYSPQKVLNSSLGNNVDSLHIADVNGDNKMDLILVDGTIMVYTAKNNGFVGINFEFNQGVNWSDWSEGSDLNTNQCVFGDYDEDGKADLAFFHNLEGPNLLQTDTTNYDDGSPNKNVMFICFSEGYKFTLPDKEVYRDNTLMAYNFPGNKQGYTYKNLNGFHSIVIFGKVMEYDSYNNLYSLTNELTKEIRVNIALDSIKSSYPPMSYEYTGDFDKNPGVEAILWLGYGENTISWVYPEKYNHKFNHNGCPAIIGNFKNGESLLNTSSNSSNNSGNMRINTTNLSIGKKYDDILEYNCTETSIKTDPNIDVIYQNHLTPNKNYKLKLSGKIKDVTDSNLNFADSPTIKDEEYELNFSTKDSEKIRALISENKNVIRYFPPGPRGIDTSTSPRPSLPNIGPGKSTSIINSPNSNKNKNN